MSEAAERATLGVLLLGADPASASIAFDLLEPADFRDPFHARVFAVARAVHQRGMALDALTVTNGMEPSDVARVGRLIDGVPRTAHMETYVRQVLESATARQVYRVHQVSLERLAAGTDPSEVAGRIREDLDAVLSRRVPSAAVRAFDVVPEVWEEIERTKSRAEGLSGIASGFPGIDRFTSGFHRGELILLGGRPGQGKSALALGIARHAAARGHAVLFFSLEMRRQELVLRLACADSGLDLQRVRAGRLSTEDWERLTAVDLRIQELPLYLDDTRRLTPGAIRARVRHEQRQHGVELVVVDYLQLLGTDHRTASSYERVSELSRELAILAGELDVPVLALSQLSRAPESRIGIKRRPQLSDLRESGQLEQDAHVVLFVWLPASAFDDDDPKRAECVGVGEVVVAKQRNGPTGVVPLRWDAHCARFVSPIPGLLSEV